MKKSIVYLLHVGFWGSHLALVVLILGILFQGNEDTTMISRFWDAYFWFAVVPSAISFYASYFILFPRYVKQKKVVGSIFTGITIAIICTIVTYSMIYMGSPGARAPEQNTLDILSLVIIFFIALVSLVLALVLRGFISWMDEVKLREALMQRNHEMEMALVKAQLDPHFLFNTINNIDVLILIDAETASHYLNKLSDILRFMLYEAKPDHILLEKEIAYIEKYVALQKLRTTNENFVEINVHGQSGGIKIAPMTLVPFVENAFKHVSDKKTGAITIELEIEEKHLRFVCKNTSEETTSEHHGLGNDLIRKRLELIYPGRYSLEVLKDHHHYSVQLVLEL